MPTSNNIRCSSHSDPAREIAYWLVDTVNDAMQEDLTMVQKICEDGLSISRNEHRYTTQSGNLQSSCGFAITLNEQIVMQTPFTPEPGENNPDGTTGSEKGKEWLAECIEERKIHRGISSIMVAGMDYAGIVEERGGDVLKSAEAHIRQEFDKLAKGLI